MAAQLIYGLLVAQLITSSVMTFLFLGLYCNIYKVSGRSILTQIAALMAAQNVSHAGSVLCLTVIAIWKPQAVSAKLKFLVMLEQFFIGTYRMEFLVALFLFGFLYRDFSYQVLKIYQSENARYIEITGAHRLALYTLSFVLPFVVGVLHYCNIVNLLNQNTPRNKALSCSYFISVQFLMLFTIAPLFILIRAYLRIRKHF